MEELKQRFKELARQINEDPRIMYSSGFIETEQNPAYQELVSMDRKILPFVFEEIEKGCHWHWFMLARAILVDELPKIPEESRGRLAAIRKIYLKWARENGLIV